MLRKVHHQVRGLKAFLLELAEQYIEPDLWTEFSASLAKGMYVHYDRDIPLVRDLKAFMNRLTAIERVSQPRTWKIVTLIKLPGALLQFKRSHQILNSTGGIVTNYLSYAKELAITTAIPIMRAKLNELYQLCTSQNFEKVVEFIIQNIITLEQYQQKYLLSKRKLKKDEPEEKSEDSIKVLNRKYESYLRTIYRDDYAKHFPISYASQEGEKKRNFLLEAIKPTDVTTKNLKALRDTFVTISLCLDNYEIFDKSHSYFEKLQIFTRLVSNIKMAYHYFQEFDFRGLIAEQTNPLAEYIKLLLKKLNGYLEKLTCIVDEIEGEMRFKEESLLKYIFKFMKRYNKVISELKIQIDFVGQKRLYCHARFRARERYLLNLDLQLQNLDLFLQYQHHALADIPINVLYALQSFIVKYEDDIFLDRDNLAKYKVYLQEAMVGQKTVTAFLLMPFETMANRFHLTLHYEIMKSFTVMRLYLINQKSYLSTRLQKAKNYSLCQPFDNFKLSEFKEKGHQAVILTALKERGKKLDQEKINLFQNVTEPKEIKEFNDEKKAEKPKAVKPSERVTNQLISITREHGLFSFASERFEKKSSVRQLLDDLPREDMSPASILLLHEIEELSALPESKSISIRL